ncbi:hypothetical protein [Pseudomonas cavernicola]|uniref:hypothetical protein n=1 Tax=Pseudomonas cavernicola TaxID=2320866 RepID=UPI0011C420C3|nr:hypothetical protein [Pseudomonas cavernicola]
MKAFYLLLPLLLAGCVYSYPEEAHDIGGKLIDELVVSGLCEEKKECAYLKVAGKPGDAIINIYEANKIDNNTLSKLISICLNQYGQYGKKVDIQINAYRETHEQARSLFSQAKPYIQVRLRAD